MSKRPLSDDNITGITQNAKTTSISYVALNRISLQTLPSGLTTDWYYDTHGFVNLILSNNGNLLNDGDGEEETLSEAWSETTSWCPCRTILRGNIRRQTTLATNVPAAMTCCGPARRQASERTVSAGICRLTLTGDAWS